MNSHLEVKIEDGCLVIKIGVTTLCNSILSGDIANQFDPDEEKLVITDEMVFADEIISSLTEESEDGSTLVHRMFDQAADDVLENGGDGIEIMEVDDE